MFCQSFGNGYPGDFQKPRVPLAPLAPQCFGFPGTPAWNTCWSAFQDNMNNFQTQMNFFSQQMQGYQAQLRQYGEKLAASNDQRNTIQIGTSRVISNGYIIQSNGLALSTSSFNSVFLIEADIGKQKDLKVTSKDNTITWEIINKGQPNKWIKISLPDSVNVSSIKYETKDNRLYISGPSAAGSGGLSFSSFSSGSPFSSFDSSFF
ncbi:unnamed protein product [Allacma fusca]|uniref:Uncharacterized protein n=2 Tax=Allacma fusca TaxID=39272 RepID=A0A8J2PNC1_9HEXA|nr:unnamed protein product [Allacma fusca]